MTIFLSCNESGYSQRLRKKSLPVGRLKMAMRIASAEMFEKNSLGLDEHIAKGDEVRDGLQPWGHIFDGSGEPG